MKNDTRILRMIQRAQATAGMFNASEVARRSGVDPRTIRTASEATTVETLRKIAAGLGGELEMGIVFRGG